MTTLLKYLPQNAPPIIEKWLEGYRVIIILKKERQTKLGDYRYLIAKNKHQITINHNLNPALFFFVLTHEIAHLKTQVKYGNKVTPHGTEWKENFSRLILESIQVYQEKYQKQLIKFAQNPTASFYGSPVLSKLFLAHDLLQEDEYFLADIPQNSFFSIKNKVFIKGDLRRTRYLCKAINTQQKYLVNKLTKVKLIKEYAK